MSRIQAGRSSGRRHRETPILMSGHGAGRRVRVVLLALVLLLLFFGVLWAYFSYDSLSGSRSELPATEAVPVAGSVNSADSAMADGTPVPASDISAADSEPADTVDGSAAGNGEGNKPAGVSALPRVARPVPEADVVVASAPDTEESKAPTFSAAEEPVRVVAPQPDDVTNTPKSPPAKPRPKTAAVKKAQADREALARRASETRLVLVTRPGTANIRFVGSDREYTQGMVVPRGKQYILEVSAPGYQTKQVSLTAFRPQEQMSVVLDAEMALSVLEIQVQPEGATITLPGHEQPYRKGLQVLQGKPVFVDIAAPGYKTHRVTVIPDEPTETLVVALEAESKAKLPDFVALPAREFVMGDINGNGAEDERPLRRVSVAAFRMAKTEVTFNQFDAFVEDTGRRKPDDSGWGRGERPVINISWQDAMAYVEWLNQQTGGNYRLPSEAEWEYAARAGTETPFYTGECIHTDLANYNGRFDFNYCGAKTRKWRRQTLPVGSLPANAWGLHDMHGNVWEWVSDCWADDYSGAPLDASPRQADGTCEKRVLRGGSWAGTPSELRSAVRFRNSPSNRFYTYGFRLASD